MLLSRSRTDVPVAAAFATAQQEGPPENIQLLHSSRLVPSEDEVSLSEVKLFLATKVSTNESNNNNFRSSSALMYVPSRTSDARAK